MAVTTALGYNYFSGAIKDENISNSGANYGSIIYSSTSFQYQNLFVAIDIAPIKRDVISYQEVSTTNGQGSKNTTTVKSIQSQKGLFLRPSLGVNKDLYKFNQNISVSLSSNVNMTFINTQGNNFYSSTSLGLGMSPIMNFNLEHNFIFNFGVCAGVDFPSPGAEFMAGAMAGLGYNF